MSTSRVNLLDLSRAHVEALFAELGEKRYRAAQVMKWIYHRGVLDFDGMTDVGRDLRQRLAERVEIRLPEVVTERISADGTRKWVVRVHNGNCVEMVLIPEDRRRTLCVSSQVGCALDCSFCSTGKQGFNGNLQPGEIIGQVLLAALALRRDGVVPDLDGITNVVLMGMGEPLLNFEAAMTATGLMMDDLAFGLSKRRVTISTAGVVPGIRAMTGRTDVALAVSLHAPTDAQRDVLVPVNRRWPLAELLAATRAYQDTLGDKRVVTFEYTLLDGINDRVEDARNLIALLRGFPCKVNLIPFNPFPGSGYARPSMNRVRAFQTLLLNAPIPTMLRTTRGDDIDAACGQLVGAVVDRTRRRERLIAREPALAGALGVSA